MNPVRNTLRSGIRRAAGIVAGVAALLLSVAPAAAAAPSIRAAAGGSHTMAISDCQHPHYKPKRIILTCGDANTGLTHLTYSRWSKARATGQGRFVYDDCTPNCAAGHFHHFHVTVTLKRVREHHGQQLFTRLVTTNRSGSTQTYDLLTHGL